MRILRKTYQAAAGGLSGGSLGEHVPGGGYGLSVGGDMPDPQAVLSTHYWVVESAPSMEELLRGLLFREVVSLPPGRYRKQISSGLESIPCD